MKVSLLYNATAGDGVSSEDLRTLIEGFGHEVVHVMEKHDDYEQALDGAVELIVAAGGDGTVSTVASLLSGRDVPFAVLPLGTANNIARSLKIEGSLRDLIARWKRARATKLDLGILRGSWGETRFIEGTGAGLIPNGIAAMSGAHAPAGESAEARLNHARQGFLGALARLQPRSWKLDVDGTRLEGKFLLVEALNMKLVGPNLELARRVNPSDGRLSLVVATDDDRQALANYLEAKIAGRPARCQLPTWHARHIDIDDLDEMHVDDEVRHWPSMGPVSINIEPGAVRVLV